MSTSSSYHDENDALGRFRFRCRCRRPCRRHGTKGSSQVARHLLREIANEANIDNLCGC
jgi:ribosomal protein S14